MSNKRLTKEVTKLIREQSLKNIVDNDYLITFDEHNMNKIFAIIKGPYDSVYRHKFIRLVLDIPNDYPHSPPKVTFVNFDGVRIHPTMYQDGKCCSTILNTWPSTVSEQGHKMESWTSSMGIETIILTFQSFLDNNPYTYEPGGRDDPSYTDYVLYKTWDTCLLKYLLDRYQPELFTTFIHNYLLLHIDDIFDELDDLSSYYPPGHYYTRCFEIDNYIINYNTIISHLNNHYQYIDFKENHTIEDATADIDFNTFLNTDYNCQICFDTSNTKSEIIKLTCQHSFHTKCLKTHINNNGCICSLCREAISEDINKKLVCNVEAVDWIINPETKRRVKIGSKTYNRLVADGILD